MRDSLVVRLYIVQCILYNVLRYLCSITVTLYLQDIMEAERERLVARLKKEVKQLMEESVTKKFIHEDSSTIASLCIVLEQCICHGFRWVPLVHLVGSFSAVARM